MLLISALSFSLAGHAAINVDRTRIIMNSGQKSLSVILTNENSRLPFLAQSFIEDSKGKRTDMLIALPPLQRIDAGKKSQVRIIQSPGGRTNTLPQDRESLFWFNVREIPPTPSTDVNVLQMAVQSQLKLFWRPDTIKKSNNETPETLLEVIGHNGFATLKNPTPYYITVAWLGTNRKSPIKGFIEPVMVAPFSSAPLKAVFPSGLRSLLVGYINDYGGLKINTYNCTALVCSIHR